MGSNDAIGILAAIVEHEGGEYSVPIDALAKVVDDNKGLVVESHDGGVTLTLRLVGEEEAREIENA